MVFFRARHSRDWHEEVHATATSYSLTTEGFPLWPDTKFPWDQLKSHTEIYLKKKGKIDQQERDRRLDFLIQWHRILHNGEFVFCIAACAGFMSAEALKSLLAKELNTVAGDDTRLISFLYATTTVHQRNSLAVTKSDSDLAITLLQCYSSSGSMTVRQKLEMLVSLWIVGISPDSFAYSRVPALIRIYAKELSSWAQSLKDSCKWLEVREETEWLLGVLALSRSSPTSGCLEATRILDESFPDWQKWAEWKQCDTELAQHLVSLPSLLVTSPEKALEYLIRGQIAINSKSTSYVYEHACKAIRRTSSDLARQVAALKESCRWLEAHKETAWLSILLDPSNMLFSGAVVSTTLLDVEFPEWRSWASWDEQDSELAKVLHSCQVLDPTTAGQHLKTLIQFILAGIRKTSLLYYHILDLARKLSSHLSTTLQSLKANGDWLKAYSEAKCLLLLREPSSETSMAYYSDVAQVLDEAFVGWKAWTVWRPSIHRLQAQERLSLLQRRSLLELLALEGPDFESSKQTTMREGFVARGYLSSLAPVFWPGVQLTVELDSAENAGNMLIRLSDAVAAACRAGPDAVDLLIHLSSSKPIDGNTLLIIEESSCFGDTMFTIDVLDILKAEKKDQVSQMIPVMRLLPKLSSVRDKPLCEALIPRLVDYISACMREMQALLRANIDNGTYLMQLYEFGKSLQTEQWLLPMLDAPFGLLIHNWPTYQKLTDMNALQKDIQKSSAKKAETLKLQLNAYYAECFIEPGKLDQETRDIVETLIDLWAKNPSDSDRREAALRTIQIDEISSNIHLGCLRQLSRFSNDSVTDLRRILERFVKEPEKSCVHLARFLAGLRLLDHKDMVLWWTALFDWCTSKGLLLFKYTIESLKIDEWQQWISDTQPVSRDLDLFDPKACRKVFQPEQRAWASRIRPYTSTIRLVEKDFGLKPPSLCFRIGFENQDDEIIIQLLKILKDEFIGWGDDGKLPQAVHASLALLKRDNAKLMHRALSWLSETTTEGRDVYLRIISIHQGSTPAVASALLAGWLENPSLTEADRMALESLGDLLGVRLSSNQHPDVEAWAAEAYITNELNALHADSKRLAVLRRSLKREDPEGVSALCLQLGIENNSVLEEEIANLPYGIIHLVEMVDANTIELSFPLGRFTALKRAGMGTGNAQNLIVRLTIGNDSLLAALCIHIDNEMDAIAKSGCHSPWLARTTRADGEPASCYGQSDRATYQLRGIIERYLLGGIKPLKETYEMIKLSLDSMSGSCISCGSPHGVQLHRSAPCMNLSCRSLHYRVDPKIYLKDLIEDPQVTDLLFTAVQAAVSSKNKALLPGWTGGNFEKATETLDNISAISTLSPSEGWRIDCSDNFAMSFIRETFLGFDGFLISATGRSRTPKASVQIRIPHMPGAYQFLLVNAAPHLERAFATKKGAGPTTVVFHGTSLDRLYAILCQGLKVLSDTPLQKNGAARGKGIYVSQEPRKAWLYAREYKGYSSRRGWKSGTFDGFYVLLACEASGITQGHDVHVVKDPSSLILRYIFLTPPGMRVPRTSHIVPPIASVCNSLRSGAL